MRFKHTKTILLIITNLLLLSLLYIGYQKIQRVREQKAYQDQFAKVTQLEKSSEKGKDVQVQEGISTNRSPRPCSPPTKRSNRPICNRIHR